MNWQPRIRMAEEPPKYGIRNASALEQDAPRGTAGIPENLKRIAARPVSGGVRCDP
jgi:hypothetical protein